MAPPSKGESSTSVQMKEKGPLVALVFDKNPRLTAFVKEYRTGCATAVSSIIATTVTYPLDFTKSRMQSYRTGFTHTVKDAYRAEGLRAFWRGVFPPVFSTTMTRIFSFNIYQRAKYAYDRQLTVMFGKSPLAHANAPGQYPSLLTLACFAPAGATAGAIITLFSCPFELTKLNEQLAGKEARQKSASGIAPAEASGAKVRKGAFFIAQRLYTEKGFTALYAGLRLHMLRDTIGTAVYFTTYETTKQLLANARGKSPTNPYAVFVAGGMCGIVSWACIYPIDITKTLYQKARLAAGPGVHVARPPIKFFIPGAYRGLGVSTARSCIVGAIFFSIFERTKKHINALEVVNV